MTTPIGLGNETEQEFVPVVSVMRHKHNGVLRLPGSAYPMEAHRVERNVIGGLIHRIGTHPPDWWKAPGRVLSPLPEFVASPFTTETLPGALRIGMGCGYDPGSQAYRLHSAISLYTKHASAFVRWMDTNPYCSLRQYDGDDDKHTVRDMVYESDVLWCHVNYALIDNSGIRNREGQVIVRHYHGSRQGGKTHVEVEKDQIRGALVVCARLQFHLDRKIVQAHQRRDFQFEWLPITVPVDECASLRTGHVGWWDRQDRPFRIAHAPTNRGIKGTNEFLEAVENLNKRGLKVEAVLIEDMKMDIALITKARCDAVFDSFWLGIATSGLEGASMGMPVLAGDVDTRALYQEHVGYTPYTFAKDGPDLESAVERLMTDRMFYEDEAARVERYTREYHDYPAVARRAEGILARAMNRPDIMTEPKREEPVHIEAPKPERHGTPELDQQTAPKTKKGKPRKLETR